MKPFSILLAATLFFILHLPTLAEDYLIPLDDRPANRLFVEQIARIGSPQSRLIVPPRYLLGQLYTPGQSDKIIEWLEQRVRPGDTVFLSADMWLYGGLVASRTADISPEEVQQRLARLESIGGNGVTLHVLATLPRLSLRTSDEQAPFELKLSKWATKKGLPLASKLLQQDAPGPEGVPTEVTLEYLNVRKRNVETIATLIELTEIGFIDSLVLGQDDSYKTGLHKPEQALLRAEIQRLKVGKRVTLLSGIDELTMNMISGVLAARAETAPRIRVIYSEPEAAKKVPPLESLPLEVMVNQHLALSGAKLVQGESADLDLYIYVPYSKPWNVPGEERRPTSEAFVKKVRQAMDSGRQVAVADLSLVNRMDPFLAKSSLDLLNLYELEGFASWNTPANTVGTVLAQAVCHQIAEKSEWWSLPQRLESEKTHQAFMLARFIDDYLYQTVVRAEVRDQTKGLSPRANPLLNLFGPVGTEIRLKMVAWAEETFEKYYLGRSFCLTPHNREVTFEQSKLEVVLPWPRVFEVEARLDLRLHDTGKTCQP